MVLSLLTQISPLESDVTMEFSEEHNLTTRQTKWTGEEEGKGVIVKSIRGCIQGKNIPVWGVDFIYKMRSRAWWVKAACCCCCYCC